MPNTKAEINKHSKNTLQTFQQKYPDIKLSNCTNKKQWQTLNGQSLTESIFYQANITANNTGYKEKVYFRVFETAFKARYGNQKKLLKNNVIKRIQNYPRSIGR